MTRAHLIFEKECFKLGLFTRNYDKPGPGVNPDEPQKRSFFRFFDIFSRKLGHFSKTNLLYSLALIPTYIIVFVLISFVVANVVNIISDTREGLAFSTVVFSLMLTNFYVSVMGAGPATAGITYIMRNFAREEHAWIGSDFKDNVKSNFKQAAIVFVIDLAAMVVVFMAVSIYNQMPGPISLLKYVLYIFTVIFMMMHMYIYPIMVTFKLPLKDIYKNSLIFTLGKLPSNLFILIVDIFMHIVLPIIIMLAGGKYFLAILFIYGLAEIAILQIFTLFATNFNVYPKMKKYMLDVAEGGNNKTKVKSLSEEIAEEAENTEADDNK